MPLLPVVVLADTQNDVASINNHKNDTECEIGPDGTCLAQVVVENHNVLPGMTIKSKDDDGIAMVDTGFGVDQQSVGAHRDAILQRFREIQNYMNDRVLKASTDDVLSTVASECQLRHELCTFWAIIGECEANPGRSLFYVRVVLLFLRFSLLCFELL
jgi:hypothetical protein